MSLFKSREWWSVKIESEGFGSGSMCLLPSVDGNVESDKLVVCSHAGCLRAYDPRSSDEDDSTLRDSCSYRPEHLLVEKQLDYPVLQVICGRFVTASDSLQLAILHPRRLAVYILTANGGQVEHGHQYDVNIVYQHTLARTAYNMVAGSFGGVKGRDFMCVQSLDGTLSIYEQESFAFSRFLPSSLLPGCLAYAPMSDSFLTVSSSYHLESYKYQVLAVASDANTKEDAAKVSTGKRVTADWLFNLGEMALDLAVVEANQMTPSILVLGERSIFCISENGQIRFMKKLDFEPSCFHVYNITPEGWIQFMVCSYSKTLLLFFDTTLKWAAQLPSCPLVVRCVKIGYARGLVATLDAEGALMCSYFGTDPSLYGMPQNERRETDFREKQAEFVQLQQIMKGSVSDGFAATAMPTGSELMITCTVSNKLDDVSMAHDSTVVDDSPIPSITVKIVLTPKVPLSHVQLFVCAPAPLSAYPSRFSFPSLASVEHVTTAVYLKFTNVPASLVVTVYTIYSSDDASTGFVRSKFSIPLRLVGKPCAASKAAPYKITIDSNKPTVNLNSIFGDFVPSESEGAMQAFGLQLHGHGAPSASILVSKNARKYRVQSEHFEMIWLLFDELSTRLRATLPADFAMEFTSSLPVLEFYKLLDHHFELQRREDKLLAVLAERCVQLRAVERRLATKFKDTTPSPLAHLDALLEVTHRQISSLGTAVHELQASLRGMNTAVSAGTQLLLQLLKMQAGLDDTAVDQVRTALPSYCDQFPGLCWEERVDAAITQLLHSLDEPGVVELREDQLKLSDTMRLKKRISLLFDKLNKGAQLVQIKGTLSNATKGGRNKLETIMEDSHVTKVDDDDELFETSLPSNEAAEVAASLEPNSSGTFQTGELSHNYTAHGDDEPAEFRAAKDSYLFSDGVMTTELSTEKRKLSSENEDQVAVEKMLENNSGEDLFNELNQRRRSLVL